MRRQIPTLLLILLSITSILADSTFTEKHIYTFSSAINLLSSSDVPNNIQETLLNGYRAQFGITAVEARLLKQAALDYRRELEQGRATNRKSTTGGTPIPGLNGALTLKYLNQWYESLSAASKLNVLARMQSK